MESQYSVKEVIEIVVRQLGKIQVPVEMMEQIGIPIVREINNLKQCLIAFEREEATALETEEEDGRETEIP